MNGWQACALIAGLLVISVSSIAGSAAPRVFAPADILDWSSHSFTGYTAYRAGRVAGDAAVRAVCDGGSASGLVYQGTIDLRRTPILEWRWRATRLPASADERRRSGDDFAARVYVVDEYTFLRWRTRALNYVWTSSVPVGTDWPNPFAAQARMVAVQSGPPDKDGWVTEQRNVRKDFQRYHERSVDEVEAVAIMTDCDNTGASTAAAYGTIRWLAAKD